MPGKRQKRESLFGEKIIDPNEEWQDMPEFVQEDLAPYHKIIVNFRNEEDVVAFGKLIGQKIPEYRKKSMSIWYPYMPPRRFGHLLYVDEDEE
jgi:hypothetical protein